MKNLLISASLAAALAAGTASAQDNVDPMLDRGTREIGLAGNIDITELDEIDYNLDGIYGYFFRDGWEAGVVISASDRNGGMDHVSVGGFTEFNFRRDRQWVPFVGGGLSLFSADFDDDISLASELDDDGVVFEVEGGAKWFLRDYMAFTISIDFQLATDDIFLVDEEIEDNLSSINIGMRYYF